MASFQFPRQLTLSAWEMAMTPKAGPLRPGGKWTAAAVREGLLLDFGKVEYTDFGVLARALLLLDAAVRANLAATVILPVGRLTTARPERLGDVLDETDDLARRVAWHIRGRARGREFMRHVGFEAALRAPHWPQNAVRVLDATEADCPDGEDGQFAESAEPVMPDEGSLAPARRRPLRVLPLQWLRPMDDASVRKCAGLRLVILGLTDLGLSRTDARTLTQSMLSELVTTERVGGDDLRPRALVGAMVVDSEVRVAQGAMPDGLPESANGLDGSVLRLLVGESSAGHESSLDGLRRIARVISGDQGTVMVRTSGTSAGIRLGSSSDRTRYTHQGNDLAHAPGTLFEVNLVPTPTPPGQLVVPGEPAPAEPLEATWMRCVLTADGELDDVGRVRLASAAGAAEEESGFVGALGSFSGQHTDLSESAIQQLLQAVLDAVRDRSPELPAVLVLPAADPRILELAVSDVNALSDLEAGRPIVQVFGSKGKPLWCGGSASLRRLLDLQVLRGGVVSVDEARRCWAESGGDEDEASRAFARHQRLFSVDGEQVALRLSVREVLATLEADTSRRLRAAIEQGGPGVSRGSFRIPTLQVVNRWIDFDALLAGTVGADVAAFILARKAEGVLGLAPDQVLVAWTAGSSRELAAQLSECMLRDSWFYTMPGELDLDGVTRTDAVPAGSSVVLSADLVATENTVRRAAAHIMGAGGRPAVITCLVDNREHDGPLRFFGHEIPVVSLTDGSAIAVLAPKVDQSGRAMDIDPIMRQPVFRSSSGQCRVQEAEFLAWCAETSGTLLLCHMEREPSEHYGTFIRLDRVLVNRQSRERITSAMVETVTDCLKQFANGKPNQMRADPLRIWYPLHLTNNYAGKLAYATRAALIENGYRVEPAEGVPRWVAGDQWAFPNTFGLYNDRSPVIVIDWGVRTATTIHNMVRLAASNGASFVVAVVLLQQLADNDAQAVSMWSAVQSPPQDPTSAGTLPATVPAAIRFVAASTMSHAAQGVCPICYTSDQYANLSLTNPPERIGVHLEQLRDQLRVRRTEDVFRAATTDLFDVPVECDDVIDLLRWRRLLRIALRDTSARSEVIDRLRSLVTDPTAVVWSRINLIRLLAVEQQWMKLPPLRFTVARGLLAEVAVSLLRPPEPIESWIRVQALMVLSVTKAEHLLERLPDLVAWLIDDRTATDQLLVDCYRLLQKPAHDSTVDLSRVRDSLVRCRNHLEQISEGRSGQARSAAQTLYVVKELLSTVDRKTRPRPTDAQSAWAQMREDLRRAVVRHNLESALLRVRNYVEDLADLEPEAGLVTDPFADWESCVQQLEERALVNLPALGEILAGEYVAERLGRDHRDRLLNVVHTGAAQLDRITERLRQLTEEPWRPEDIAWDDRRRSLLKDLNWWYEMFLATHRWGRDTPALLVELIADAPCDLKQVAASVLGARGARPMVLDAALAPGFDPGSDLKVFCPRKLLEDAIGHALANIERHRMPGAIPAIDAQLIVSEPGSLQLSIRNTGTMPTSRSGQGIRSLDEKLKPFGGRMSGNPMPGRWAFEAVLTLARWKGA